MSDDQGIEKIGPAAALGKTGKGMNWQLVD